MTDAETVHKLGPPEPRRLRGGTPGASGAGDTARRGLRRWIATVAALEAWVSGTALHVAGVSLAILACVLMYQVIARFVLGEASAWTEVSARALMVWVVWMAAAVVLREGMLASVELLRNTLQGRLRRVLETMIALVTLVVLVTVLVYGIQMTGRVAGQRLAGLEISIAWAYAAIPIGAGLGSLAVLVRLAQTLLAVAPDQRGCGQ